MSPKTQTLYLKFPSFRASHTDDENEILRLTQSIQQGKIQSVRELIMKHRDTAILVHDTQGRYPLHLAAASGDLTLVKFLARTLEEASVKITEEGYTALHLAVANGELEVIYFLACLCQQTPHSRDHTNAIASPVVVPALKGTATPLVPSLVPSQSCTAQSSLSGSTDNPVDIFT